MVDVQSLKQFDRVCAFGRSVSATQSSDTARQTEADHVMRRAGWRTEIGEWAFEMWKLFIDYQSDRREELNGTLITFVGRSALAGRPRVGSCLRVSRGSVRAGRSATGWQNDRLARTRESA